LRDNGGPTGPIAIYGHLVDPAQVGLGHDAGRYSQRQGALNLSLCEDQSGAGVSAFPAGAAYKVCDTIAPWPDISGTPWGHPVLTGRNLMTNPYMDYDHKILQCQNHIAAMHQTHGPHF